MAVYEAFSCPLQLKYKARLCSKTTLFLFLTNILTFILPLIIIYTEGIWRSVNYYREQPDVSFKHKALLLLETDDLNNFIFWSTFKNLNELIHPEMQSVVPLIEVREEDYNRDGKYDEVKMEINIPLKKEKVHAVKLLLMFDYKLHLNSNFKMECAAYIHHSSSLAGSSLHVVGDLNVYQREPLIYKGTDSNYNIPVIDELHNDARFLKLEYVFSEYMKRNITAFLLNQYPVWKSGRADDKSFVVTVNMRYPEQTLLYNVQLGQLIKELLVQYVAFYAIFSFVFYRIKLYVFQKQFVPSILVYPLKQK